MVPPGYNTSAALPRFAQQQAKANPVRLNSRLSRCAIKRQPRLALRIIARSSVVSPPTNSECRVCPLANQAPRRQL